MEIFDAYWKQETRAPLATITRIQPYLLDAAEEQMKKADVVFERLNEEEMNAWKAFAKGQVRFHPINGVSDHALLKSVSTYFKHYYAKFLRGGENILLVDPGISVVNAILKQYTAIGKTVGHLGVLFTPRASARRIQNLIRFKKECAAHRDVTIQGWATCINITDHDVTFTPGHRFYVGHVVTDGVQYDNIFFPDNIYDWSPLRVQELMVSAKCWFAYFYGAFSHFQCWGPVGVCNVLDIEFSGSKDHVVMRFNKSTAAGFVHNAESYYQWANRATFKNSSLFKEFNLSFGCIRFGTMTRLVGRDVIPTTLNYDLDDSVYILSIPNFLKYRMRKYHLVPKYQLDKLISYCCKTSKESFEPTKVIQYLESMQQRYVIGGTEVQKKWTIDRILGYEMTLFAICYSSMLKGESTTY